MTGVLSSEGRIGDVLAAVGNHEGKALTYLAMEPGEPYGIGALHHLFLDIQGDPPAFRGQVTLQQKYCTYSFEPIGLVRRSHNEKGNLRHERVHNETATALVGHVLSVSERHSASLLQIFGKTANRTLSSNPHAERPPTRRLAVMRALVRDPSLTNVADLARASSVPEQTLASMAVALGAAGVLGFRTRPTYELKSAYFVREPVPLLPSGGRGGRPVMREAIVGFLNSRIGQVVARDDIEQHVRAQPVWRDAEQLRDSLQKVMLTLTRSGDVDVIEDYGGQRSHTVISLTAGQRGFLVELVDGIDAIEAGDDAAVARGCQAALDIVGDVSRVRGLVSKAFGAVKAAHNPVSAAEKDRRVLRVVQNSPGVTSADIVALLGPDLDKAAVSRATASLTRAGLVHGEKQPDGPYKRWYPESGAHRLPA